MTSPIPMQRAIVFDVFGTLIGYSKPRINAYRHFIVVGKPRQPFLTRNVPPETFAEELELSHLMPIVQDELGQEIAGLRLFDDVLSTLETLRYAGKRVAVASNLAQPYGAPVRALLPGMDAYVFSHEIGAKKPDPAVYRAVCEALGCRPADVLWIGDSRMSDVEGPNAFGMTGRLIDRRAGQTLADVLGFLS